ncbi:MAG: HAD family hydrolase [Bacteroidales bacterium]|nr:HAD family hydrolase [Bacteroidales bacterium]
MFDTTDYPTAIAFDLDDTLYSEADYVDACLHNVARELGKRTGREPSELYDIMASADNAYDALCDMPGGAPFSLDEYKEIYRSTMPRGIMLRPDARELLDTLRTQYPDIPLYIITDGRSVGQRNKIAALALERRIDAGHIIISGESGYDKHTPMPFSMTMMRENRPLRWVYVGDNPAKDFRWPNLMGWTTVMLDDIEGRNVHAQPADADIAPEYRAQIHIANLNELPTKLNITCQQH